MKPLSTYKGIGNKRLAGLESAGIHNALDVLSLRPVSYINLSAPGDISALIEAGEGAFYAWADSPADVIYSSQYRLTRARLTDGSRIIYAVWFNMPYIAKRITPMRRFVFYGHVSFDRRGNRQIIAPRIFDASERRIIPVYKLPDGMTQPLMQSMVAEAYADCAEKIPELFSVRFCAEHGLTSKKQAVYLSHFPESDSDIAAAEKYFRFEEVLLYMMLSLQSRRDASAGSTLPIKTDIKAVSEIIGSLPYSLTKAQKNAFREIAADMAGNTPMNRLMQGDVGCGKTIVAFLALYAAARAGRQGALMAPTEILASQHYESAKELFGDKVKILLLTGSMPNAERKTALEKIRSGKAKIIIGTHALLQPGVEYNDLGLVITDEQHRFGVAQRAALRSKGLHPHMLVMSATPIPRTLSLILYGDLDITVIDEMPLGRKPIKTNIVPEHKRTAMYGFIRQKIAEGDRCYVLCPLIESSDALDAENVEEHAEMLAEGPFRGLGIACIHGRIGAEKEEIINGFKRGDTDVLVCTTVIEVGVNVPEANIMVIENAERYGLAQLHQLRGRVGRGNRQAYCFLMTSDDRQKTIERLSALCSTNDGFIIAEKDLALRGPGEIFGPRQHGAVSIPLISDGRLLQEARLAAEALMDDPSLGDTDEIMRLAESKYYAGSRGIVLN